MSNPDDRQKHGKRINSDIRHINRQISLGKTRGIPVNENEKYRYNKLNCITCGNSNCVMCGNPRKMFRERTVQEKSFDQINLEYIDELVPE